MSFLLGGKMFTLTCDVCGAKSIIKTKKSKQGKDLGLEIEGDVYFYADGYEGDYLVCRCDKCKNIVSDML